MSDAPDARKPLAWPSALLGLIYVSYGPTMFIWGARMLLQRGDGRLHVGVVLVAMVAGVMLLIAARGLAVHAPWGLTISVLATAIVATASTSFALSIIGDGIVGVAFGSMVAIIGLSAVILTARVHRSPSP